MGGENLIATLYKAEEKLYNHNGLGSLHELVEYQVTEVLNGEFEALFEYPVTGQLYGQIEDHMLIKAKPNRVDKPHVFRIYETELDIERQSLVIYARSKNYDLASNMVRHTGINSMTPEEAWRNAKAASLEPTEISFTSNITTPSSTEWTRRNLLSCIVGEQGSMLQIWGGELKHDVDRIQLWRRRGDDNVTTIRYGKNLAGLKSTYSTKGLVTAILPYFSYRPEEGDEEIIVGNVVKSDLVNAYPYTHYDAVEFTEEDGVTTPEDLNRVAGRYFRDYPDKDKPSINMEINMLDLSHTKEYERFKGLEEVKLGDTVTVYAGPFGIDVTAKVTKIVYNGLTDENEVIEVGTTRSSQFENYRELVSREVNKELDGVNHRINIIQTAADGKGKNFRGPDEPTQGMQEGDLWFKELGEGHIEIYQYNGWTWGDPIVSSRELDKVSKEIEEQQAKLEAFEQSLKELQDRNDEELAEFDKQLEELRQSGVSEEQIDEAIKRAGFDSVEIEEIQRRLDESDRRTENGSVEIEKIRRRLGETSDTAELAVEMIGNDGKTRYSRNRVDGATDGQIEFGGQPLEVTHNGDGFVAGQTYTISFNALCELLEQIGVDIRFNYPTDVTRSVTVTFKPDESLFDTVEQTVESRFRSDIFKGYRYTMTIESDWYKSIERSVESEEDIVEVIDLAFKDVVAGDLTSDRILNWNDNPDIVFKGVM